MKGKNAEDSLRGNGKRRKWSAAEKLRIVLRGIEPGVDVADLCRREGLAQAQYYQWKRVLLGAADRIFERKATQPTAREQRLTQENGRMKDVIAEITSENLELKKTH